MNFETEFTEYMGFHDKKQLESIKKRVQIEEEEKRDKLEILTKSSQVLNELEIEYEMRQGDGANDLQRTCGSYNFGKNFDAQELTVILCSNLAEGKKLWDEHQDLINGSKEMTAEVKIKIADWRSQQFIWPEGKTITLYCWNALQENTMLDRSQGWGQTPCTDSNGFVTIWAGNQQQRYKFPLDQVEIKECSFSSLDQLPIALKLKKYLVDKEYYPTQVFQDCGHGKVEPHTIYLYSPNELTETLVEHLEPVYWIVEMLLDI